MTKHTILFLAAHPSRTDQRALDREARAIRSELERSGHRDRFELETRWAAEPLDLLRELRDLRPLVVHFSGHGGQGGLFFQDADGDARLVSTAALVEAFGAAGGSVRLVVLSACYSEVHADALLAHVDHVVGMGGSLRDDAARSFAIGFYGGLGEGEPVSAAYRQGCAAISLEGVADGDRPRLRVRDGRSADQPLLPAPEPAAPEPPAIPPPPPLPPVPPPEPPPAARARAWKLGGVAATGAAAAVLVAVLASAGDDEPAVQRRLAALGDPPPPATCAPAAAGEAGALILTARDQIAAAVDPAALDAAIATAARAIERCPDWAAGHNVHGNALAKAARHADAVASYARAQALAPDYAAPRFNLGLVQLRRRDPAAVATFTELIARNPDLPDVHNARGKAHLLAKQYVEALTDFEEAVRRKPDDGIAWMSIGQLREQLARPQAREAFCRAAELGIAGAAARCPR